MLYVYGETQSLLVFYIVLPRFDNLCVAFHCVYSFGQLINLKIPSGCFYIIQTGFGVDAEPMQWG